MIELGKPRTVTVEIKIPADCTHTAVTGYGARVWLERKNRFIEHHGCTWLGANLQYAFSESSPDWQGSLQTIDEWLASRECE